VIRAEFVHPKLTTLRQPLKEIAARAVSELVRIIQGDPVGALHIELPARLIVRESTAPAPAQ
jgi:LacI family transcriptional regulator